VREQLLTQIDLGRWLIDGYAVPGRDGEAVAGANRDEEET